MKIRKNHIKHIVLIFMILWAVPSDSLQEQDDIRIVKASGSAVIYKGDIEGGKKKAILEAKRNAVEMVGTQVIARTVVENFILVKDRIITKADGYIHSYKILGEKQRGENYVVEIEAQVSKSSLVDDATSIYYDMNKPRIMVIIPEMRGKEIIPASHAENIVSEFFIEKEFSLIDRSVTKENIRKDEMRKIAEGDKEAAAKVGLRAGAEVVVVGTASLGDVESVRGVLYASRASVSVKAIRTDNASLYAVSNKSKSAADGIADAAQRKALETTSKSAAKDIFWKIVKKWNDEIIMGSDIEVVLSGVSFSRLRKVLNGIREIEGVTEVIQRSFDSPTAVLNITYRGKATRLAEYLDEKKFDGFNIEVLYLSSGKINIKINCHNPTPC